ncbi:FAD-dependent oxidoreductase [Paenibacillus sp. PR3]|uniref:FAD-dependent oxidoreductase n=1 Tax=Paenibacillus terricola TaxID=2763503 RepID=A0ABR8MTA1_9BACL|nr:FAD-dependent oxidoreductase [Paenibacillus terricola]MBD3919190.1 FAD-dependent oxidoreductase [Paenibacillus terricola]
MKSRTDYPVIIIGAGVCGLRIASLLSAEGIPCRVLEARGRIGGRVLTEEVFSRPELGRFDLGPTWFWPQYEPTIANLINELGLKTFPQYSEGNILSERSHTTPPQQFALPDGAMESSVRLEGGVQSLIDAIAATLPSGTVELNQRVKTIRHKSDGLLTVEVEGMREEITASAVILALPPRLAVNKISFEPALSPELRMDMMNKPTWMAGQAKVLAIYERPFWRDQGLAGFATSWAGPLQEIHDASPLTGSGALFGFFGLTARKREELGEQRILKLVDEQLRRLFGPLAAERIAFLYKDWSIDSDTATSEDAEPIREYPDYGPHLNDPTWNKKVWFAGTETASAQGGHLEGALQSADRTVYELLKSYRQDH